MMQVISHFEVSNLPDKECEIILPIVKLQNDES